MDSVADLKLSNLPPLISFQSISPYPQKLLLHGEFPYGMLKFPKLLSLITIFIIEVIEKIDRLNFCINRQNNSVVLLICHS